MCVFLFIDQVAVEIINNNWYNYFNFYTFITVEICYAKPFNINTNRVAIKLYSFLQCFTWTILNYCNNLQSVTLWNGEQLNFFEQNLQEDQHLEVYFFYYGNYLRKVNCIGQQIVIMIKTHLWNGAPLRSWIIECRRRPKMLAISTGFQWYVCSCFSLTPHKEQGSVLVKGCFLVRRCHEKYDQITNKKNKRPVCVHQHN